MEQVEIEITSQAITQQHGVLQAGDVLRVDADFAEHLVNEARAAKYTKPRAEAKAEPEPVKAEPVRAVKNPVKKK